MYKQSIGEGKLTQESTSLGDLISLDESKKISRINVDISVSFCNFDSDI
jgi:hypothetical protein